MDVLSLADALRNDLSAYPVTVRESPLAVLAMQLAALIDQGIRVPECSRELRQCLAELRVTGASASLDSELDQLQAKRDQRRNA